MKKLIAFSFICWLPFACHAEVIINEIMYDLDGTDTDREWIEVMNTGSTSVDLATYKFFEANTNHSLVPDGSSSIPPGGFAIIVDTISKFKADWPNYSGLLFDSSFSLNNDPGETLALKDATNTIVNQVSYTADPTGAGAGKSLQKNGESWVITAPTPGAVNATSSDTDASGSDANGSNGTSSEETVVTNKKPVEPTVSKRTVEILAKQTVTTRSEVIFEALALDLNKEKLTQGKFMWNFGDGSSEVQLSGDKIKHVYYAPGEYVVTLDYSLNPYVTWGDADASDRLIVTVEDHKLAITSFDVSGNIALKNNDTKEFDLSSWVLVSGSKSFILPKNTIILPSKSLFFPSQVTGFQNPDGMQAIELLTKENVSAFIFPIPKKVVASPVQHASFSSRAVAQPIEIQKEETQIIPLAAAATESNTINTEENKSSGTMSLVTLATIVVLASASTLYFRHKQRKEEEADADDIAIVDS